MTGLEISPFRGVLYRASPLDAVLAPPYDVISPAEREALAAQDPHNAVRLILPSGDGDAKYAEGARTYRAWLSEGVLQRDRESVLYRYQQIFHADGREVVRTGFVGAVRLRKFSEGVVLPHERTHSAAKKDRFNLTRACRAWFSQVFALYSDPSGETSALLDVSAPPDLEGRTRDGTTHRIWRIRDGNAISALRSAMAERRAYIADGHHRYETMLALRDEIPTEEARSGPVFLCRMEDPGLVVFATHRVVHSLGEFDAQRVVRSAREMFDVEKGSAGDAAAVKAELLRRGERGPTFAMVAGDELYFLSLRPGKSVAGAPAPLARLDVTVLHDLVLERILGIDRAAQEKQTNLRYVKDFGEALREGRAQGVQAAFLLNPTRVQQLKAVADAGEVMPQKSTYFFPKLASGLVSYPLDP